MATKESYSLCMQYGILPFFGMGGMDGLLVGLGLKNLVSPKLNKITQQKLVELGELLGEVLAKSSVIDPNLGLIGSLVRLDISLSLPKERSQGAHKNPPLGKVLK
jgi:hypothetical protein